MIIKNKTIRFMSFSALMAALIFLATFLIKIPTPLGYIHIGDAFVYLSGCLLPMPYAIASSAIGAALADMISGYPIYVVPSVIIKALTALCFTYSLKKFICKRNLLALIPSYLLCVGGYYFAEVVLQGNFSSPLVSIPFNSLQVVVSGTVFILIAISLDKIKFKERNHFFKK